MKKEWKTYFRIGIFLFILFLCIYYWSAVSKLLLLLWKAITPLLIGLAIAYIVNILMSFYEKYYFQKQKNGWIAKSRRPVCMFASFVTLLGIVVVFFWIVIPAIGSCIQLVIAQFPTTMVHLTEELGKLEFIQNDLLDTFKNINWNELISKLIGFIYDGIGGTVNLAADLITFLTDLIVGLIFSVYLLLGKDKLKLQMNCLQERYFNLNFVKKTKHILAVFNDCFHSYIVGQSIEAVILGVLCAVGMLIFGFPYAATTGLVIGTTALIPIWGAYIGGAVGFLLILTISPIKAFFFLLYLVILQQVEGNLIYPRVVGESLKLPGIWVFVAVIVGGGIYGVLGMVLAVPITAAVYRMIKNSVRKKEIFQEKLQNNKST